MHTVSCSKVFSLIHGLPVTSPNSELVVEDRPCAPICCLKDILTSYTTHKCWGCLGWVWFMDVSIPANCITVLSHLAIEGDFAHEWTWFNPWQEEPRHMSCPEGDRICRFSWYMLGVLDICKGEARLSSMNLWKYLHTSLTATLTFWGESQALWMLLHPVYIN